MSEVRHELEALQLALKTEEEGYKMYKAAADLDIGSLTRAMFAQLAKDELLHKDLIKRFYTQLKEAGSWKELSEKDRDYTASKKGMKTIFSDALKAAKKGGLDFTATDNDAYRKAIEFEKNGMEMYDRLYNKTSDPAARQFYAFLREMEREHMEILERAVQYLNSPDNYYLLEEGWTLDD